tara:strand:- start:1124 stop:3229 length:2106 start_codon:yes stop_codon:yes gene_type:complete
MTLAYDGSNYMTFRTDSSGILTISGATTVTYPPFQVLPGGGIRIDRYTRLMRDTTSNGLNVDDGAGNAVPINVRGVMAGDGYVADPDIGEVQMYSSSNSDGDSTGKLTFNSRDSAGTTEQYAFISGTIHDATHTEEAGQLDIGTLVDGTSTPTMTIVSGNVGIGTTTPDKPFVIRTGGSRDFKFYDYDMTYESSLGIRAKNNGYLGLVTEGTNSVFISTNGFANKRLVVDSAGDVGIGTVGPNAKLDVRGTTLLQDVTASGTIDMTSNNGIAFDNTNNNNQWFISNRGTNAATLGFGIGNIDNSNLKIAMSGDGYLGIGDFEPNAHLDVRGTTILGGNTVVSGTTEMKADSHTPLEVRGQSGYGASIKYNRHGSYGFYAGMLTDTSRFDIANNDGAGGGEALSIDSSKNVGIGTTGPNATLDVKGNTVLGESASSTVIVSGALGVKTSSIASGYALDVRDSVSMRFEQSASQRLLFYGQNDHATINVTGSSHKLALQTGGPGISFQDGGANEHLLIQETGTNNAHFRSAGNMYFAASGGTSAFTGTIDAGGNVAVAGNVTVDDNMTVSGSTTVEGQLLSVQKQMKNDITANYTVSTDYSHYLCHADAQTITITMPTSPSVGDEYWIVARTTGMTDPHAGGIPGQVQIQAGSGGNINLVDNGSYIAIGVSNATVVAKMKMAHIICIESDVWAMTVSDECPTS